jgi:hypothetical protein
MCVVDTVCDCDKLIVMTRAGMSDDRGVALTLCVRGSFTYLRDSTRTITKHRAHATVF